MTIGYFLIDNIRSIFNIYPIEGWDSSNYKLIIQPIDYTISYNSPRNQFYQVNNGFMLYLQLYWVQTTYNRYPDEIQLNDLIINKNSLYNDLQVKIENNNIVIKVLNIDTYNTFKELEYNVGGLTNNLFHDVQSHIKVNMDVLYNLFQRSCKTKDVLSTTHIIENIFNLLEITQ